MYKLKPLNIYYEEPDPDRWFKYDRYPRKIIRRIFRDRPRPSGQMMVAINLLKGLDKLGIPYRFNDYKYAKNNPKELIGVIGKPHLIFERKFKNPILFGASVFSHPIDCPTLLTDFPNIKKVLVPGPWIKIKFDDYYGDENVIIWPTGIDTYTWNSDIKIKEPQFDFLIYDKVRWEHEKFENELISPIQQIIKKEGLSFDTIRYGYYEPEQLKEKIANCKFAIFLCEHETQGIAYQQILATGTPILAWNRKGFWQDPEFYPDRVKYEPVSSIPYWDNRCGEEFENIDEFREKLKIFLKGIPNYNPEDFIAENLTLEKCAQEYVNIYDQVNDNF